MDYPFNVGIFTVTGVLAYGVADGADPAIEPDLVPIPGAKIVFTPDLDPAIFRVPTGSLTVFQEPVEATTNINGEICGLVDGTPDVQLVWGGDPDIIPSGWSWRVTIEVPGFPVREFSIAGSDGGTVDLGSVVPVPPDPGGDIPAWEAVVAQTESARDAAIAAAASVQRGLPNGVASLDAGTKVPVAQIPDLDAAKVTSGSFAVARIPSLDASKIGSGVLALARIPNLDAAKITTGQFATGQIPNLDAAKVTSGVFAAARIPAPPNTGWSIIQTGSASQPTIQIAKIDTLIHVLIDGAMTSLASGAQVVYAGVVPVGMRPTLTNFRGPISMDAYPGVGIVGTNGDVTILNRTGAARGTVNASLITYPAP